MGSSIETLNACWSGRGSTGDFDGYQEDHIMRGDWLMKFPITHQRLLPVSPPHLLPYVFSMPSYFSRFAGSSSGQRAHRSNVTRQGTPFTFNLGEHLVRSFACCPLSFTNLLPRLLVTMLTRTLHTRSSGIGRTPTGLRMGLRTCTAPTSSAP